MPRHTHTFDLGLGLTATVTYRGLPPLDPPASGSEWFSLQDHPRVAATLRLPGVMDRDHFGATTLLDHALRAPGATVLTESLSPSWGAAGDGMRSRSITYTAADVGSAYAAATTAILTAIATLREVVSARAARLAEREATIARAMESAPPGLFGEAS